MITLLLLGGLYGCREIPQVKGISIHATSLEAEGRVVSIDRQGEDTLLILDTEEKISIHPPLSEWPSYLEIGVGDRVTFLTKRTIGNETRSLYVSDKGASVKRMVIVLGSVSPIVSLPREEGTIRYRALPGEPISPDPDSPYARSGLLLHYPGSGEIETVLPGEVVPLEGDWFLYLVRVRRDNPAFPVRQGVAQESSSFDYDYILYRNPK